MAVTTTEAAPSSAASGWRATARRSRSAAPASGELLGTVVGSTPRRSIGRSRRRRRRSIAWRRTSVLERVELCRRALRHLHGALRGDRADDHARGRQDDPRVARGDGRVHRRPLPPRLRGHAAPRRAGAAVDAGALEREADRGRPGAGRRRRGRVARGTSRSTSRGSRSCTGSRSAARWSGSRPSTRRSARTCSPRSSTTPASRRARSTSSTGAARSARARAPPGVASVVFTGSVEDGRAGRARRRPQEPRARARRQRPADRARRRRRREGRRRGDRRLLLPRRPVLHRRRAHPRPRVVKDGSSRRCSSGRRP